MTPIGCFVIPVQCILPQADKAFDATGRLTSIRTQETARAIGSALIDATRKLTAL